MKLKTLFKDFPSCKIYGNKEDTISGISLNSKLVSPKNLFVAKKGLTGHGHKYVPEAISAGASAILTDVFDPTLKETTQIITLDPNLVLPSICSKFYGDSSARLFMCGITGTNGKTTICYFIKHLLDSLKQTCGLMGTVQIMVGDRRYPASHTTSDVATNHRLLKEMEGEGCKSAVMEVTSHGLDQGRVDGLAFDVAAFSNLSIDHLDYHSSMEEYYQAKKKLFLKIKKNGRAVINIDCPYGKRLLKELSGPLQTVSTKEKADFQAINLVNQDGCQTFDLMHKGKKASFSLPLIGEHNVSNALIALSVVFSFVQSLDTLSSLVSSLPKIPGRLEPVENSRGYRVFIDFAHTPDALEKTLCAVKKSVQGRLHVLFGCGGNRDREKRALMGQIASKWADVLYVTSDNPRNEDPSQIIQDILKGIHSLDAVCVEPDRRCAIEQLIEGMDQGDVALLLGKGHEKTQVLQHQTIEFDEISIAKNAIDRRGSKKVCV